jgi:hypothetical protein
MLPKKALSRVGKVKRQARTPLLLRLLTKPGCSCPNLSKTTVLGIATIHVTLCTHRKHRDYPRRQLNPLPHAL